MKAKRASLTQKERREMIARQGFACFTFACTGKPTIAEHWHPVALGNGSKPDCILCADCAKAKTYGSAGRVGGDTRDIKHTKKLAQKRTQADKRKARGFSLLKSARKLIGRGFDKTKTKGFDGKVRDR